MNVDVDLHKFVRSNKTVNLRGLSSSGRGSSDFEFFIACVSWSFGPLFVLDEKTENHKQTEHNPDADQVPNGFPVGLVLNGLESRLVLWGIGNVVVPGGFVVAGFAEVVGVQV